MANIKLKAMDVVLADINDVYANDYNPNIMAKPEKELLKTSILNNGFCFPIVVIQDEDNKYCLIDGFHRFLIAKELKMPQIPVVILDHDISKRISATVQFNRARGTHQSLSMSKLVVQLIQNGKNDDEIAQELGMDKDEVLRLKQVSGLKAAFKDQEFSKSWEEFDNKWFPRK
ncbi:ParB N-terminal domain-containing protein [Culicoidibacter larvae]|uniref:Chromosome partitioning protein ParB n=1 Tax=Culicoidibacter larvae TaxID=2579976 RepID=A0A5R8QFD3_9FIRM|nr:ParB N-terminal domain-containing protein [Culicoidibacter larvae]TLG76682.1 chromosome partitioning protein ParB [Culicoidibacter larvae]